MERRQGAWIGVLRRPVSGVRLVAGQRDSIRHHGVDGGVDPNHAGDVGFQHLAAGDLTRADPFCQRCGRERQEVLVHAGALRLSSAARMVSGNGALTLLA